MVLFLKSEQVSHIFRGVGFALKIQISVPTIGWS
jgi:hypothetical protein